MVGIRGLPIVPMKRTSYQFVRISLYHLSRKYASTTYVGDSSHSYMTSAIQVVKNTLAENTGNLVKGAHALAPADSQFSLSAVPDLSDRVALVTGGSEGVGYGCTHTLLSRGVARLFVLSKDDCIADDAIEAIRSEMGDEVAKKVEWIQCDLSDWEEARKTAFKISEKVQRLDILINNAARGIMTAQLAQNGVDLHFASNHVGHVVLTSHLLPLLKKTAKRGNTVRIVNLASNLHESSPEETKFESLEDINTDYGPQAQYGRTKLCSILYSKYLNRHLTSQHSNILANATHPGIVQTRQSTDHIHEAYPFGGYAMSVGLAPFKKTQFEGAVSTLYAATMTKKSGQYICPPAIVEPGSAMANDDDIGEKLMNLTRKLVKEKMESTSADRGCPFKDY